MHRLQTKTKRGKRKMKEKIKEVAHILMSIRFCNFINSKLEFKFISLSNLELKEEQNKEKEK